jgi:DNA invertase Pin-like site-specific DNA recombinase
VAEVRGMARVLGACRESGKGEESISILNQQNRIRQWADDHAHTIVSFTVDKATSGGMAARKREDLGPWLTDPAKIAQWDILAAAKLDRGWRSVLDFAQTQEWADERGKALVSVAEGYDFTTPEGELMAYQLIAFAQFERKRGAQRRSEGAEVIKESGRWGGGWVPFGYAPVGARGNWRLIQDKVNAPIARRIVADILAGKGLLTVAKALNAEGVKPPRGGYWRGNTIRQIVRSPALMGYQTHMAGRNRDSVTIWRNSQGQPVKFTDEPLISEDQWRKLQDAIKARARARIVPQARHMLAGVLYCRNCSVECDDQLPCPVHDVKLYGHRRIKHVEKGNRYRCPRCGFSISLPKAETTVERLVMRDYGNKLLLEPVTIAGDDHAVEIRRLERRGERLREELDDDPGDDDLKRSIERNQRKIDELKNAPHEPERTDWLPVIPNITVEANWEQSDTMGRNKFLRDYRFVFYGDKDGLQGLGAWTAIDSAYLSPPSDTELNGR